MASPAKIPPSIANASPDELKILLVKTLQKLKARDNKITELTTQVETYEKSKEPTAQSEQNDSKQLADEVQNLQIKLQNLEKTFEDRVAADTEALTQAISESNGKLRAMQQQLDQEQTTVSTLKNDVADKTKTVDQLEKKLSDQRQQHESAIKELESQLASSIASAKTQQKQLEEQLAEQKSQNEALKAAAADTTQKSSPGPPTPVASPRPVQSTTDDNEAVKTAELESKLQAAEERLVQSEKSWTEKFSALEKTQAAANGAVQALASLVSAVQKTLDMADDVEGAIAGFKSPKDVENILNSKENVNGNEVVELCGKVAKDVLGVQTKVAGLLKQQKTSISSR